MDPQKRARMEYADSAGQVRTIGSYTDEERRNAALESQKKYRAKKKYCDVCVTTLGIKHFTRHLESNDHKLKNILYNNLPNKWLELMEPEVRIRNG